MKEVEFLEFILKGLVENKEDIDIVRTEDELWVLLTVKVNKDDMWIIIWKWGNTVNSLRSILKVLWIRLWKKINLKILD